MSGHIVENWRLIAESIGALADHLDNTVAWQVTPVTFANLPPSPKVGMIACITDNAAAPAWGGLASGGGTNAALVWYNGTAWTIIGK